MSKEQFETVTLRLPKQVVDFIRDRESKDVQKYLEYCIVDLHMSDVECVCQDTMEDPEEVMDWYGLKPVFRAFGVLPSYYKDP